MATFHADMAAFGARLKAIVESKDVAGLQALVLDMCKYRDDMKDVSVAGYRALSATIDACNGALWAIRLNQVRYAKAA